MLRNDYSYMLKLSMAKLGPDSPEVVSVHYFDVSASQMTK